MQVINKFIMVSVVVSDMKKAKELCGEAGLSGQNGLSPR